MRSMMVVYGAVAGLAVVLCGCTSTGTSTSNTTATQHDTITGKISTDASVNLDHAYNAARDAIKDLRFTTVSEAQDALNGVIKAKTADDKSVEVRVTKLSDNITRIVVDAGVIDRSLAESTMEAIRRKL